MMGSLKNKGEKVISYLLSLVIGFTLIVGTMGHSFLVSANAQNLLINGGFESGLSGYQTSNWSLDSSIFHGGVKSAKVTGDSAEQWLGTSVLSIDLSYQYDFSVWIKTDSISNSKGISVNILPVDVNDNALGWYLNNNSNKLITTGGTSGWTEYSFILNTSDNPLNSNTSKIYVYLRLDAGCSGSAWFDDIGIHNLNDIVAPVTANVLSGEVDPSTKISLTTATDEAEIYYTNDGSDPLFSATRQLYSQLNGVVITADTQIKAYAIKTGYADSNVTTLAYTVNLISDGDFENALPSYRTDKWVIDTNKYYSGTQSAMIEGNDNEQWMDLTEMQIDPSAQYMLTAWIRTSNVSTYNGASLGVLQIDSNQNSLGWYAINNDTKLIASGGTREWTKYNIILNSSNSPFTSGMQKIALYLRLDAGSSGQVWFDHISISKICQINAQSGSVIANYPEGVVTTSTVILLYSSNPDMDIYYTTDESDPSTSTTKQLYSDKTGINVANNIVIKSFATGNGMPDSDVATFHYFSNIADNGFESGLWGYRAGNWSIDTSQYHEKNQSAKVIATTSEQFMASALVPINRGYSYQLSLWIKTSSISTSDGISVNALMIDSKGNSLGWYGSTMKLISTGLTQDWTKYTATLQDLPQNISFIDLYCRCDSGITGTAWIDDFSISTTQLANQLITMESSSGKLGNIYTETSNMNFNLVFENYMHSDMPLTVSYNIIDADSNSVIGTNQINFTLGSMQKSVQQLNLNSISYFGTFKVEVNAQGNSLINLSNVYYISRINTLGGGRSGNEFGVNGHLSYADFNINDTINLATQAGFKWIRDDMNWSVAEQTQGVYTIDPAWDQYVDKAREKGLNVLAILAYGNTLYDGGNIPSSTAGINAYANYCAAIAEHFLGRVNYFEIGNEYNYISVSAQNYAQLVQAASQAIKQVNPNAVIVAGAALANNSTWLDWMSGVLANGAYNYIDVLSLHPYSYPDSPETGDLLSKLQSCKSLFGSYGSAKPIWISEIGWPTSNTSEGISQAQQRDYEMQSCITALQNGLVDKIFLYDVQDDGLNLNDKENNFGMVNSWQNSQNISYSAKDSYVAFSALTSRISGAKFVTSFNFGSDVRSCEFHRSTDDKDIVILWSVNGTHNLSLNFGTTNVNVFDKYGNPQTLNIINNNINLDITSSPVYIEVNSSQSYNLAGIFKGSFEDQSWSMLGNMSYDATVAESGSQSLKTTGDGTAEMTISLRSLTQDDIDNNDYYLTTKVKTTSDYNSILRFELVFQGSWSKVYNANRTDSASELFIAGHLGGPAETSWCTPTAINYSDWTSVGFKLAGISLNETSNFDLKITIRSIGAQSGNAWMDDIQIFSVSKSEHATTGVTVSPSSISIMKDTTTTLISNVMPIYATNKNVTWSSSNAAVATVNSSGVVTAVAVGTATITATTVDGNYTADCAVTVTPVPVTGVTVDFSEATIGKQVTKQLTATVNPTNADNKAVTWSTSNAAIATVSTSGLVTAVAVGTATITATTVDGSYTATCAVTVKRYDPTKYYKITYNSNSVLAMDATNTGLNGTVKNVTYTGADSQQWQIIETTDASTFKIVNKATGYALKVNSTTNSTNRQIIQTTYSSANNMNFTISEYTGYVQIVSKLGSSTYIKSTGTSGGTLVTAGSSTSTRWDITLTS